MCESIGLVRTWELGRCTRRQRANRRLLDICEARKPRFQMLPIGRPGIRVSCFEHITVRPHCHVFAILLLRCGLRL